LIGKEFGSYKIESKIGEGGMGVVYRATDTDLDRPVAIKMVLDSTAKEGSQGAEAVARFLREAKAASRLQHPAIVHIYKFGVQDNTRYLVMEFIEGKNLRAVIARRPMPVERICEIAAQVADGLGVAHEMGVIHRDLKAENIMVTSRGQAKILDFGLAKVADPILASEETTMDDGYKTQLGTVLGTVSSMSPEQAMGREVDAKADIFSLGVVLYEMATGANPFLGPTPQATLARILHHQPELVSLVNPAIPPELERLIHLCLRKEPKQRPSAQEVTHTCKRLLATVSSWSATAPALGSPSAVPVLVPSPAPAPPASGAAKPPSGSQRVSSPLPPAPASPATVKRLAWAYYGVKAFRILMALATLTVPLSFFVYMLVAAQIVRIEIVEGTAVWSYVRAIVIPALAAAEKVFTFRPVVSGWNLMLLGLGLGLLVIRHLLMLPIERMEFSAKARLVRARANPAQMTAAPVTDRGVNNRLTLLREYSEGQQRRSSRGQRLAILSIDVVGWSRMTMDEDALVTEHAFAEYKKFIDRLLRSHNAQKTSFSPGGTLCAFESTDDAVAAAQAILKELPWFNEGVHKLKSAFHVRCGVNSGELALPEGKTLDELRSAVIDIAADMQKSAPPDTLWLSGEVLAEASDGSGFATVTSQKVDGRTCYEWRALASSPTIGKPSSARSAD